MDKYLKRKWARAQLYTPSQVVYLSKARGGYWYAVQSSRGGWYRVWVKFDEQGKLVNAWCECPDHGDSTLRGVAVCKHALAAALAVWRDKQCNS